VIEGARRRARQRDEREKADERRQHARARSDPQFELPLDPGAALRNVDRMPSLQRKAVDASLLDDTTREPALVAWYLLGRLYDAPDGRKTRIVGIPRQESESMVLAAAILRRDLVPASPRWRVGQWVALPGHRRNVLVLSITERSGGMPTATVEEHAPPYRVASSAVRAQLARRGLDVEGTIEAHLEATFGVSMSQSPDLMSTARGRARRSPGSHSPAVADVGDV